MSASDDTRATSCGDGTCGCGAEDAREAAAPLATGCAEGTCTCGGASEGRAPALWRSLDELQGSAAFQEAVENEFPRQAVPLGLGVDRRRFMQLMGASLALGGAAACTKQPLETIVPYVQQPEEIVPGVPLSFATAAPIGGGYALGVLATSHMGRPTKIEGNPEHPASLGSTDVFAQASVLGLYDPDRSKTIINAGRIRTWEAFVDALTLELARQESTGGAGLRILSGAVTSPSLAAQIAAVLARFPQARWYQWEPAGERSAVLGSRAAFGRDLSVRYDLAKAQVVVALDCDLLGKGPGAVRYSRDFARGRRVWESAPEGTAAGSMNRLYAVECTPSPTSTLADHRVALKPAEVGAFAAALAAALGVPGASAPAGWNHPEAARLLPVLAKDLLAHRGSSVVAAGDETSPELHVLAHAINAHLGNHRLDGAARRADRRAAQRCAGRPRVAGRRAQCRQGRGAAPPRHEPGLRRAAGPRRRRGAAVEGGAPARPLGPLRRRDGALLPLARQRRALPRELGRRPRLRRHRHRAAAAHRAALRRPLGARGARRLRRARPGRPRARSCMACGSHGSAASRSGARRCTTDSSPTPRRRRRARASTPAPSPPPRRPSPPPLRSSRASPSPSAPTPRCGTAATPTTPGCRSCRGRSARWCGTTRSCSRRAPPASWASTTAPPTACKAARPPSCGSRSAASRSRPRRGCSPARPTAC